jgi:hypothetical protein
VEVLKPLDVALVVVPLGNCLFDPLPTYLQSLFHIAFILALLGQLRLFAKPFDHRQKLGDEAGDSGWKLRDVFLNDVEFLELRR